MKLKAELTTIDGDTSFVLGCGSDTSTLGLARAVEIRRLMGEMRAAAEKIAALVCEAEHKPAARYVGRDGEVARGVIAIPTVEPPPGEAIGADGEVTRVVGAQCTCSLCAPPVRAVPPAPRVYDAQSAEVYFRGERIAGVTDVEYSGGVDEALPGTRDYTAEVTLELRPDGPPRNRAARRLDARAARRSGR